MSLRKSNNLSSLEEIVNLVHNFHLKLNIKTYTYCVISETLSVLFSIKKHVLSDSKQIQSVHLNFLLNFIVTF